MFRKLLEIVQLTVDGRTYQTYYFEHRTARGARRYSCEVVLDATDRIILDDDSLTNLEARLARLAPATICSRALAAGHSIAAA